MNDELPSRDDIAIWDAWFSSYRMPALAAADDLGLFEVLHQEPASAAELAARTGLNEEPLKALLPMLSALGFLVPRLGRYHLTSVARAYLLHDSPFYWGHAFGQNRANPVTRQLIRRLGRGDPSEQAPARHADAWESGQASKQMALAVAIFMHSHSLPAALGVARQGIFGGVKRLLDVGGGSGCFSIALAQRHADLRCTIMELPTMCEQAMQYITDGGVSGRVDTVSVDMFRQAWPTGYDAIFMSNIFHDWDLEINAGLATSAFAALPSGGRIFLHEMLINDEGSGPLSAASFSMMMLLGTKGRQYSLGELKAILEHAGFTDVGAADSYGYFSLVDGRKP